MTEEERRQMASRATSTLGRNLAVGGFGNPMGYTPPTSRSVFGASAQQSSEDFSRMQMPPTQAIPFDNTIPAFPDNYNQAMTDRSRDQSVFGLGQTPPMAPATDAISSFGNPLASRTERIESQYGTVSTTLTPEQQQLRFQEQQKAQQMGTMPRTPEQQQALLAQMRQTGRTIAQNIQSSFPDAMTNNPRSYATPMGKSITAPTNMFGQPIADFQQRYAQREERLMGQRASSIAALGATGFGAMQRQQANIAPPPPIRAPSLFGGMGYASTFGGPQPASSTFATGPTAEDRRRRIFGTV
jgi:hypothetical protein